MGFLKGFKFWDTNSVIENTLESVSKSYFYYKKKRIERDRNFWLAAAFMNRPGYYSREKCEQSGVMIPFIETMFFSVLEDDHAALALGLFFLSREMPRVIPKLESQYREVMRPANDLIAQANFAQKWEEFNPWTVKNIDGMREAVYFGENKIA